MTKEELEKENEIFKKANEIIAQQRDDRDADISKLENRIEDLEAQIEKMKCCEICANSKDWRNRSLCIACEKSKSHTNFVLREIKEK